MSKITNYQLFAVTFIFQLGTTIIFGFGGSAGRDAWIGELASCGIGVFVILIYIALLKLNPGLTLVQWFPAQFGRWIGTPIGFLYPLLFIYLVGRNTADIRDMVSTALLSNTPLLITSGLFVSVIAYSVYGGIRIVARLGEMFLPIVLILFCIEGALLAGSSVMHIHHLQPILEHGWKPIWKLVFPSGITLSFGETIALAMFWPEAKNANSVMKITLLSTLLSGLMVTLFDVMAIMVFGDMFAGFLYPLYTLLSVISIGEFIENLQMFGVLYFLMTALLKSVVYMYAAVRGIQQLANAQSSKPFVIPACAVSLFLGLTMSKNIAEHIYRHHFEIMVPYVWVPLLLIIPAILLAVTSLRVWIKRSFTS